MARIRIAGTSGASENTIVFSPAGGHSHNGRNSSLIDSTAYSMYDFSPTFVGTEVNPDRAVRQENNRIALEDTIKRVVNNSVLAPAGIRLEQGSLNGSLIIANTITANQLAANTITAAEIFANTITADQIAANTITADELVSNIVLVNNIIRSNVFTSGSAGWRISNDGTAEFSNVVVRGNIFSNVGTIGGWTLDSNSLFSGTKTASGSYTPTTGQMTIGSDGHISANKFRINSDGSLFATGADISGAVTATTLSASSSGRIGPFDFTDSGMNSISYNAENYMQIYDYGDITVYSAPLTGGHASMRHRTDLVGEYIQVARLAGYGSGAPTTNRYITLGSSNAYVGHIGIEIVEDNTSRFRVYEDGNVTAAGFIAAGATGYTDAGSVSASGWFRSKGQTGWYSQDYGGGIYMADSTYVQVYNGKEFYVTNSVSASNYYASNAIPSGAKPGIRIDRNHYAAALGTAPYTYPYRCFAQFVNSDSNSVSGSIEVSGLGVSYNTSSDRRLKENIVTMSGSLDVLKLLNPVEYSYIGYEKRRHGFIAQDLHAVYPHGVEVGDDNEIPEKVWSVDYGKLTPLLVSALKELAEKVERLESAIG